MKKIIALLLVVALTAALSVSLTLAYLKDEASDVNVMTLGLAKIDQIEKQRVDMNHQDQQIPAELKDWEISALYPAVNTNGGAANDPAVWAPGVDANEAYVNYGTLVDADIEGPHWTGVWDKSLKNVKDKMVFVKNTGDVDVYYRTIILYEYDETKTVNAYGQDMIHFNTNNNVRFAWSENEAHKDKYANLPPKVTVNGETYGVLVATYLPKLLPNTTSRPSLLQVGLDGDATNDVVEQFGETYDILVISQAVQAEGFADAWDALQAGFGEINEDNLIEWFEKLQTPVVVDSADDLEKALVEGKNVVLSKDITTEQIEIPAGVAATIDLNGKKLTGADYTNSSGNSSLHNVINNSGNLTITGEGEIRTRNIINNSGAKLVIDGNITITGGAVGSGGSAIWNEGSCVINGATIKQANDWNYAIQNVAADASLVINDATVSANHGAISNTGANTTLEVNGGTFECLASGHTVYVTAGEVIINGGKFVHSQSNATSDGNAVVYATANVVVNGGTFDSTSAAFAYSTHAAKISINAGTFQNNAVNAYGQTSGAKPGIAVFVPETSAVSVMADGSVIVSIN